MDWLRNARRRPFFKYGAPFLILMVGGSFGLEKFTSLRYEFRKGKQISPEEAEKYGIKMKKSSYKSVVEEAVQDLQQKDLENWQNIRGPRPWEDSKTVQDLQRNKKTS